LSGCCSCCRWSGTSYNRAAADAHAAGPQFGGVNPMEPVQIERRPLWPYVLAGAMILIGILVLVSNTLQWLPTSAEWALMVPGLLIVLFLLARSIRQITYPPPYGIKRWRGIRAKGRRHFVLWYGVAAFGGVMSLVMSLLYLLSWFTQPLLWDNRSSLALAYEIARIVAASLAGGFLWAVATWWLTERLWGKYLRQPEEASDEE